MVTVLLASLDRRSEDVRVFAIVIAKLKFRDIERHIFAAHFVERADHAALENRPETFDGLSVDCADDILASGMVNGNVREIFVEAPITGPLIGAKQTYFVRNGFADESGESGGIHVCDHARNDVTLATNSADDRRLAGTDTAGSTTAAAFILIPVLGQAADESFIDFDNAAELVNVLHQCDADFVAHGPSCLIRTEAHIALDLQCAHAFLAREHEVDDAIPITERLVCVLEDRSGDMGEHITVRGAFFALPMPFAGRKIVNGWVAATRATNALWPAARDQIGFARLFVRERFLELCGGQLMNWLRLFGAGHDDFSTMGRPYHA
jgi:hypothetical protein